MSIVEKILIAVIILFTTFLFAQEIESSSEFNNLEFDSLLPYIKKLPPEKLYKIDLSQLLLKFNMLEFDSLTSYIKILPLEELYKIDSALTIKIDSLNQLGAGNFNLKIQLQVSDEQRQQRQRHLKLNKELFNIISNQNIIKNVYEDKKRQCELMKKYKGSKFMSIIIIKKIKLGMTKKMVMDSWGEPNNINRTVGAWGTHEQWIYEENYLYFENGILTSFQD
jgi:hypothetical protein